MPKVSICIPTYNRADIIPYAIRSVLDQTESDFELIICDDGSSDHTPTVMDQFIHDSRIRYIRHPRNIGKSNNMRSGFEAASGEYFIKFDDDDRLTPDFLTRAIAILDSHPEIDLVSTDHWIIDINNQRDQQATDLNSLKWGRTHFPSGKITNLLPIVFIHQSLQIGATLFRRAALLEVDFLRPNMQNCEDNDLLVRLALAGKQAYYLGDRLMEYRVHAEQQGIHRAIPYLRDKIRYLEYFQFEDSELERVRTARLAESKLLLGLRLIETGETALGRELVQAGRRVSRLKTWTGLGLSLLPLNLRQQGFQWLRQMRA